MAKPHRGKWREGGREGRRASKVHETERPKAGPKREGEREEEREGGEEKTITEQMRKITPRRLAERTGQEKTRQTRVENKRKGRDRKTGTPKDLKGISSKQTMLRRETPGINQVGNPKPFAKKKKRKKRKQTNTKKERAFAEYLYKGKFCGIHVSSHGSIRAARHRVRIHTHTLSLSL